MTESALVRTRRVLERCGELGFAAAGVCAADPSAYSDEFAGWLARGEHGSMAYMAERVGVRTDVRLLLEGARSVLMIADLYARRGDTDERLPPGHGRVARYARGKDYHKVMKQRLHALCDELGERCPGERFRAFVDTAPVMERELAARCGIGWQGKHTLTINPVLGSYFLLGGIVTTMELVAPPEQPVAVDHCGTCTRCIDACPTRAIEPYRVNATRCVSYLTIEHRGAIEPGLFEGIGDRIFGCDVCQEVCPHNSPRAGETGVRPNEAYRARRAGFDLLDVLGWNEEDRREGFRGSALKRARLEMMKRNAIIAAGNALRVGEDAELRAAIARLAEDPGQTEPVRQAAGAVVSRRY